MNELKLEDGCNPNQKPVRIFIERNELRVRIVNGNELHFNFKVL